MIIIIALAAMLAGCGGEVEPILQPSVEGITMADLQSTVTESPAPVLLFMVTTYLVQESHLEAVRSCYEILPQDPIRFRDKEAFEANGLFASLGSGMMMGPVGSCLVRMGAEQLGNASLILNPGAEMPFTASSIDERMVSYIVEESREKTVPLYNGTLSWTLTARPDPASPRRARIRVEPVFTPRGIMNWPGAESFAQKMSYRFETAGFDVLLREADFVILSVNRDALEEMTTLEKLLFLHSGRQDKVRLYAIVFIKAEG